MESESDLDSIVISLWNQSQYCYKSMESDSQYCYKSMESDSQYCYKSMESESVLFMELTHGYNSKWSQVQKAFLSILDK